METLREPLTASAGAEANKFCNEIQGRRYKIMLITWKNFRHREASERL